MQVVPSFGLLTVPKQVVALTVLYLVTAVFVVVHGDWML